MQIEYWYKSESIREWVGEEAIPYQLTYNKMDGIISFLGLPIGKYGLRKKVVVDWMALELGEQGSK